MLALGYRRPGIHQRTLRICQAERLLILYSSYWSLWIWRLVYSTFLFCFILLNVFSLLIWLGIVIFFALDVGNLFPICLKWNCSYYLLLLALISHGQNSGWTSCLAVSISSLLLSLGCHFWRILISPVDWWPSLMFFLSNRSLMKFRLQMTSGIQKTGWWPQS